MCFCCVAPLKICPIMKLSIRISATTFIWKVVSTISLKWRLLLHKYFACSLNCRCVRLYFDFSANQTSLRCIVFKFSWHLRFLKNRFSLQCIKQGLVKKWHICCLALKMVRASVLPLRLYLHEVNCLLAVSYCGQVSAAFKQLLYYGHVFIKDCVASWLKPSFCFGPCC